MRVLIVSDGPSSAALDPCTPRDITIGVNAAATRIACEWWCVGDAQTILRHSVEDAPRVIGRPAIASFSNMIDDVGRVQPDVLSHRELLHWEMLRDALQPPQEWDTYSGPASLVLATWVVSGHADASIEVHGVDMTGDRDAIGVPNQRFNTARWTRERRIWSSVLAWVRDRGITVDWTSEMAQAEAVHA
jgi:hypothetical protein